MDLSIDAKSCTKTCHGHCRLGGTSALVLAPVVCARPGLSLVLYRQDAIADSQIVGDGQIHQRACGFIAQSLVMRGLAADHASKGNITVIMLVTAVRESDCGGNLERAGHADTIKSRARSLEGT